MKVLFISNDPSLLVSESGTYKRMKEYAEAIGTLFILTPSFTTKSIDEGALHIRGIACTRFTRVAALTRTARTVIEENTIEVVSAQDPFEQGLAAMRAVQGTTAKLHIQVHTDFLSPWFVRGGNLRSPQVRVPMLNRVRRRIARKVLPKADGIRVVSERIKDSLMHAYGNRIATPQVIPICVSPTVPEPVRLPPHPFTFTLITVSRLEPEKRIDDIINALARVTDAYPAVGLMIVGEGAERAHLERLVKKTGLEQKVMFLGWRNDAFGLVRNAQAYIQTSAYEGYGRTLVEAALVEVPIITTDVGIVGEVFTGYRDVLSVPVADPAALAVHIRELVENVALRTELSMHATIAVNAHLRAMKSDANAIAENLRTVL